MTNKINDTEQLRNISPDNMSIQDFVDSIQEQAEKLGVLVLVFPRDMSLDRDSIVKCYEAIEKVVNAGPGDFLLESSLKFHRRER